MKFSNGLDLIDDGDIINVTNYRDKYRVEYWDYFHESSNPSKYKAVIWIKK